MTKIKRNDPCPCGSGKKYKKCCLLQPSVGQSMSFMDDEGLHVIGQGSGPSDEELEEMTKEYQKQMKLTPEWKEIVKELGEEKAEELLKQCKVENRKMI